MTGTQYSCLFWSEVNNYQCDKIKMEKCSSRSGVSDQTNLKKAQQHL